MTDRVLIVTHVPWEGPHRIADALTAAGLELDHRRPLAGDELPQPGRHAAAVFMGGPMNVDQIDIHPALSAEREWIADAHDRELPLLGVCLGAQLIARALGAPVTAGAAQEIGWGRVKFEAIDDPLTAHLAPDAEVLHWHGDVFDLPAGAALLASGSQTAVQGFRSNNCWAFLFHAEADLELAQLWLAERSMRTEAERALGPDAARLILERARELDPELRRRSDRLFAEFAEFVRDRVQRG